LRGTGSTWPHGDWFAEVFAAGGLGALVFDYRDAITFAGTLAEVDASRIGAWGSSYSGGHVLVVGAIDRRVRCVVSQVPLISGHRNARRLIRAPAWRTSWVSAAAEGRRLHAGVMRTEVGPVDEGVRF
jgi:hypothetical protein